MPAARRRKSPFLRLVLLITGLLVMGVSPLVGIIPGPGGVFVFAAGLVLVLQNSGYAQKVFARTKRRWPRFGRYADMALRRRSARRRRERERDISLAAAELEAAGLGTGPR